MAGDALADAALLLSDADIASIEPTCREYAQLMKQALRRQGSGGLVSTPKYGVRLPGRGEWFAMPAGSASDGAVGVKWVGTTAVPSPSGRPTVNGLIVLNDPVTGGIAAMMSAQRITAGRTAAVTAVALELFAGAETRNVCLVGTGVEARAHARMLDELFSGVETVSVVSRSSLRAQEFCRGLTGAARLRFLPAAPQAAVRAADAVIVTSSRTDALIRPEWLSSGSTTVFVSGVLGAADVLAAVDRIYVDDLPLLSTPEGRARFPYGVPEASADMASVQCGRAPGRGSAQERIAVIPFGMGAFDISAAEFVFRRAQDAGVGHRWHY